MNRIIISIILSLWLLPASAFGLMFFQGGGGPISTNYVIFDAVKWGSDVDAQAFDIDGTDLDITGGTGAWTTNGTISGGTITDGTTSIASGNYTGVGNITGDDVDISAGTGDFLTTGNITIDSDTGAIIFGDGQEANVNYDASSDFVFTTTGGDFIFTGGTLLDVVGFINTDETVNQSTTPSVNASQTAETLQDGSAFTGTDDTMATTYQAVQFTASAAHTMGDFTIRVKEDVDITNTTTTLTGYIYPDDGGTPSKPTDTALTTGLAVRYGTITAAYQMLSLGTERTLVSGTKYWLVLKQSAAPVGGNIILDSDVSSNMGATSADGSAWTNTDVRLRYVVRGRTYYGVYGSSTNSFGVRGSSTNSFGVRGSSTNNYGVSGYSANNIGVYGSSTNYIGVRGSSTNSLGVYGISTNSFGVYGSSTNSFGVYGISTTNRAARFYRNNTAGTATTVVVDIVQDSATSETNTVLRVQGDGTGDLLNIFDAGTEVFTILDGGHVQLLTNGQQLQFGATQQLTVEHDGDDAVITTTAGDFVFTGGNVGINTAAPSGTLEITDATDTAVFFDGSFGLHVDVTASGLPGVHATDGTVVGELAAAGGIAGHFEDGVSVVVDIADGTYAYNDGTLTIDDAGNLVTTGHVTIDSDSSLLRLGDDQDDFTVGWDGGDGVFTLTGGDFVFTGGNVGIGTATPNAPLEVKGAKPGGNVGGFQSGMFHVTGAGTAEFSNSVITGHSAYDTNTQLWYLGSTSSSDNNIAFINRQNASIKFSTNNTFRMVIGAAGDVVIGDATNYAAFAADGELTLAGTARIMIDRNLDPDSVKKGAVGPGDGVEDNVNYYFATHDYQATNDESIFRHFEIPHDYADAGAIHVHVEYFVDTAPAAAKNVTWGAEYKKHSIGDNFDFTGGTTTTIVNDAITTGTPANDKKTHVSGAITLTTAGFVGGDFILIRFFRDADASEAGATDDFADDVRVFNYHLEYLSDRLGEAL